MQHMYRLAVKHRVLIRVLRIYISQLRYMNCMLSINCIQVIHCKSMKFEVVVFLEQSE